MRLVCARSHPWMWPDESIVCDTFGAWLFHLIGHSPRVARALIDFGFVDSDAEYEIPFWRWDYWNSKRLARRRAQEQRFWEGRRAAARARWGETAG